MVCQFVEKVRGCDDEADGTDSELLKILIAAGREELS